MSDKITPIPDLNPHYTDNRFRQPQTVWLAAGRKLTREGYVKGAEYNYSDRIWQWDWNKADACIDTVKANNYDMRTAAGIEIWLRLYFDDPALELVHVMAGFNLATGYPYQVYGYLKGQAQS